LIRKLDAGCLGYLYNRPWPEIACELGRDGFIVAVAPQQHLIVRVTTPDTGHLPDWGPPEPLGFVPGDVAPPADQRMAEVRIREAAPDFRRDVLLQWQNQCAITGEQTPSVLEAAHLHPYVDSSTNDLRNGIALRADLHRLLDAGLISIARIGTDLVVRISRKLAGTAYMSFDGRALPTPQDVRYAPAHEILHWLNERFEQAEQED